MPQSGPATPGSRRPEASATRQFRLARRLIIAAFILICLNVSVLALEQPRQVQDNCAACNSAAIGASGGFWGNLFDTADFPPRWHCGNWDTALGVLHITSDIAIWMCYLTIPIALIYFMKRREDLPFKGIFVLFGAFIVSCGTTHLLEAVMFYYPMYRLLGLVKLITAATSIVTVAAMLPIIPKALSLRTAEELAEQIAEKKRAVEANAAKSQFLATMSHEIRTPLTAILGYAENLRDEKISTADRMYTTETIIRNGQHLLDVLNDILDLSKIEAGRMSEATNRCSPWKTILDLCEQSAARAAAKRVNFSWKVVTPVPALITTDLMRLRQILFNLLGNAVKFTEEGTVSIQISTIQRDDASHAIQFDIADTGIGIAPESVARLFDTFSQADPTMSRRYGGSGLGLIISRRLARILGGDVQLISTAPREGSAFRCTVATGPIDGVPLIGHHEIVGKFMRDAQPVPSRNVDVTLDDVRVLLVEDTLDNQRLIVHVLKKAGASVNLVENGRDGYKEALAAKAAGRPFDVILMDMQMPIMDGYDATRNLRAAGYEGVIIALTANAMIGDREKCIAAGCNDFAPKPINRKTLIEMIALYVKPVPCSAV